MRPFIFVGLLLGVAQAASAAPYLNIEANQSYSGGTLCETLTDIHYGTEGSYGAYSWYAQGGPSLLSLPNENSTKIKLSGKLGGAVDVGSASIYGELAGMTSSGDPALAVKAGVKWDL